MTTTTPPIVQRVKPLDSREGELYQGKWYQGVKRDQLLMKLLTTTILGVGAIVIIIPLIYMASVSLKSKAQLRGNILNPLPLNHEEVTVNGRDLPLYNIEVEGELMQLALLRRAPQGHAIFINPDNPEAELDLLLVDATPVETLEVHWENYNEALTTVPFGKYLMNTLKVTFIGMTGMLISCSLVAYGFSRFRAPWLNVLFLVLLSTIMLPRQVTLIPLYVLFQKWGWVDTLLPLIVPQFFANAYDVFLLRQFFMTIPLEQDEAAKIDGASSWQVLWHIILPQSKAALVTVAIFHFLYAWNDFYEPLIFLHSRDNWTMAVGLQTFNALYAVNTHLIMAASVVMIIPPILLFFLAQQIFMQGVVITGSKG
jgi:multiple sugar transport system permease protein